MGTVTKPYTSIWPSGHTGTILTSDAIRAFDDIIDEANGSIESVNLDPTFTIKATNINFTSSYNWVTASTAQLALSQFVERGYNDIHYFPNGTKTITIFAGTMHVVDQMCRVYLNNITIQASDSTNHLETETYFSACQEYAITVNNQSILTASDFRFVKLTDVSMTNAWDAGKFGYYYNSGTERILGTVVQLAANTATLGPRFEEGQMFQRPNNFHRYVLSSDQMSGSYFVTNTGAGGVTKVERFFDMSDLRYYYWVQGLFVDGNNVLFANANGNIGLSSTWYINNMMVHDTDTSKSYYMKSFQKSSGTTMLYYFDSAIDGIVADLSGTSSYFSIELKQRPNQTPIGVRSLP